MRDDEKAPWPTSKAAAALVGKASIPEGEVRTTPNQITLICQMMDKVIPDEKLLSPKIRVKRPGLLRG